MNYELTNNIAILSFDDGKMNVVGHTFLDDINAGLDRAEADKAGAVILRGREGVFSSGFDLKEFEKGMEEGLAMVTRGFKLLLRLYGFPLPLVAACTGHGIAMGAFMIMACDTRIGTRGEFKHSLPETKIGMELPAILVALTEACIDKRYLSRVALQSEPFLSEDAVAVGFLDEVVDADELDARAMTVAEALAKFPQASYADNKLRIRAHTLAAMQASYDELATGGRP